MVQLSHYNDEETESQGGCDVSQFVMMMTMLPAFRLSFTCPAPSPFVTSVSILQAARRGRSSGCPCAPAADWIRSVGGDQRVGKGRQGAYCQSCQCVPAAYFPVPETQPLSGGPQHTVFFFLSGSLRSLPVLAP